MTLKGPHIVLVELYHRGHHRSYLEMIVDEWVETHRTGRLTLLVSTIFADTHTDFVTRLKTLTSHNVGLATISGSSEVDGKTGLAKLLAANRAHKSALLEALELEPDHIVCMFFDHAQGAVAALSPAFSKAGVSVSGIFFRPTLHEKESGFISRITSIRKKVILKSALKSSALTQLFCLDPEAPDAINQLAGRNIARWLPDGTSIAPADVPREAIRKIFDVAETETLCLFFGVISGRKGIYQVLESFQKLSALPVCLVIAGSADPTEAAEIYQAISEAQKVARIIVVSGEISDARMTALFEASDLVLAAYPKHVGSSGILIRAAAAGKPVLGSRFGMVGRNIARHQLGRAADCNEPEQLVEAIKGFIADPTLAFDAAASSAFARSNSSKAFAQTILTALASTDGLNMEIERKTSRVPS